MTPRRKRPTTLIIGILIIVLALASVVVWYARYDDSGAKNASSVGRDESGNATGDGREPSEKADIYQGEFVCLPHKDTSGPQTMECAFGLKDAQGTYYMLKQESTDLPLATIPTGSQITVTGTLQSGEHKVYQSAGTITLTKIVQAEN